MQSYPNNVRLNESRAKARNEYRSACGQSKNECSYTATYFRLSKKTHLRLPPLTAYSKGPESARLVSNEAIMVINGWKRRRQNHHSFPNPAEKQKPPAKASPAKIPVSKI